MKRMVAVVFVVYVVLLGSASEVQGQDIPSDSVISFVESFLGAFVFSGQERPSVRMGQLPSKLPTGLEMPAGASVAGSVEFPSLTFIVLRSDMPNETARSLRASFEAAGWILSPQPPGDRTEDTLEAQTYCRDNESVGLSTRVSQGSVFVLYMAAEEMSACTRPTRAEAPLTRSPIPELELPPGLRRGGGSSSGSSYRWTRSMELRGNTTTHELLAHYADQLRLHGADVSAAVEAEGGVLLARIRLPEVNDEAWVGTLTVLGESNSNTHHVHMYVVRQ